MSTSAQMRQQPYRSGRRTPADFTDARAYRCIEWDGRVAQIVAAAEFGQVRVVDRPQPAPCKKQCRARPDPDTAYTCGSGRRAHAAHDGDGAPSPRRLRCAAGPMQVLRGRASAPDHCVAVVCPWNPQGGLSRRSRLLASWPACAQAAGNVDRAAHAVFMESPPPIGACVPGASPTLDLGLALLCGH